MHRFDASTALQAACGSSHRIASPGRPELLLATNLRQVGVALTTCATDWADRQVTYVRDNLGMYNGNVQEYSNAVYGAGALALRCTARAGWAASVFSIFV